MIKAKLQRNQIGVLYVKSFHFRSNPAMAGDSQNDQVYRELHKIEELVSKGFTDVKKNSRILRQCQGTRERGAVMVLQQSKAKEDRLLNDIRESGCTLGEQTIRLALILTDNNMIDATVMLCQEMRDRRGLEEEQIKGTKQGYVSIQKIFEIIMNYIYSIYSMAPLRISFRRMGQKRRDTER